MISKYWARVIEALQKDWVAMSLASSVNRESAKPQLPPFYCINDKAIAFVKFKMQSLVANQQGCSLYELGVEWLTN
jgi:hypothetical protein